VVKPGLDWQVWVIVPEDGQTVRAVGGERTYGYETVDGGRAEGFELRAGDRATLVRSGLPFALVEWRIERAPQSGTGFLDGAFVSALVRRSPRPAHR
jgi:hypothetical protein